MTLPGNESSNFIWESTELANRYRVLRAIQAESHIYFVEDLRSREHRYVFLHPQTTAKLQASFQQAVAKMGQLQNDHIARIVDSGVVAGKVFYIVQEAVSQTTIESHVKTHGKMSWSDARRISLQICEAMRAVHYEQMIHGALSPQWCFLQQQRHAESWVTKVANFAMHPSLLPVRKLSYIETGVIDLRKGWAPEQERVTVLSDVFGLGAVMYYMLTGLDRVPRGKSNTGIADGSLTVVRPRELVPDADISAELESILLRALDEYPERRFQQIGHFQQAILDLDRGKTVFFSASELRSHREGTALQTQETSRSRGHTVIDVPQPSHQQKVFSTAKTVTDEATLQVDANSPAYKTILQERSTVMFEKPAQQANFIPPADDERTIIVSDLNSPAKATQTVLQSDDERTVMFNSSEELTAGDGRTIMLEHGKELVAQQEGRTVILESNPSLEQTGEGRTVILDSLAGLPQNAGGRTVVLDMGTQAKAEEGRTVILDQPVFAPSGGSSPGDEGAATRTVFIHGMGGEQLEQASPNTAEPQEQVSPRQAAKQNVRRSLLPLSRQQWFIVGGVAAILLILLIAMIVRCSASSGEDEADSSPYNWCEFAYEQLANATKLETLEDVHEEIRGCFTRYGSDPSSREVEVKYTVNPSGVVREVSVSPYDSVWFNLCAKNALLRYRFPIDKSVTNGAFVVSLNTQP